MHRSRGAVDPRVEGFWYVGRVGEASAATESYEVICPHCRLFVPYDRGAEPELDDTPN